MVQGLHNPPQFGYKPLSGTLFPSTYPFDYKSIHEPYSFFFLKYFISQNSFFALPKCPLYANYEVLVHALNQNVIDFSHADIHELANDQMTEDEIEKLLTLNNLYTADQFLLRKYQCENLDELEQKLIKQQGQVLEEHKKVQD